MATEAKEVRVSTNGTTWYTLPGGSGEWNDEADQITDTIFSQTFESTQPGLITWTANANALYKGFAGYVASLKQTAANSTATTNEACTLVSGKTYQINNVAHRVLDPSVNTVVKDGAAIVSNSNINYIDYLFGRVIFLSTYSPVGAITITGAYFVLTEIAKGSSFTLTQTCNMNDKTDFPSARANNGYRIFEPGLRTVSLEIGGFYDATSAFWTMLESRDSFIIEINPDGSGLSTARGIFKLVTRNQSGDVGALEEETRTFNLAVPENMDVVFDWRHSTSTTMSLAIQTILTAWLARTLVHVQYLPEGHGNVGFTGQAFVTDCTLSSSMDAMNEFTANFQGTDNPDSRAVVP